MLVVFVLGGFVVVLEGPLVVLVFMEEGSSMAILSGGAVAVVVDLGPVGGFEEVLESFLVVEEVGFRGGGERVRVLVPLRAGERDREREWDLRL